MAMSIDSRGNGVPFLVSAGIVYEIVAAACSSPQTAEINIGRRADTLMKWVNIGLAQSAFFVVVASIVEPENAVPIIAGGALAAGIMYASYAYAKKSGLENPGPSTEDDSGGNHGVQEYS